MKNIFILFLLILLFQSCLGMDIKDNEMNFSGKQINFFLTAGGKKIQGSIETIKDKYDILIQIGDNILSGQILPLANNITYSLIYKKEFVKGSFIYDSKENKDNVSFMILDKSLTGEIFYQKNSALLKMDYTGIKIDGTLNYDNKNSIIKWTINYEGNELAVSITEKPGKLFYTFSDIPLKDDQIIIFLILEILRIQK
jgi:hypothetical protein